MDDYRNQNPDRTDDRSQTPSSDSSYDSSEQQQNNNRQQWQNSQQPSQQQWQDNQQPPQQPWQSNQQFPQQQWQGNQPGGQQYWQNNQPGGQQYWQNNQPGGQQYWQNGQPPRPRNNKALASMIFGILSLLACCIPFIQFPLAMVAIVLVILSKKKQPLSGFAIAGLVMGIISIIISILMTFYWGAVFSMLNDPDFMNMYNEMLKTYQ